MVCGGVEGAVVRLLGLCEKWMVKECCWDVE